MSRCRRYLAFQSKFEALVQVVQNGLTLFFCDQISNFLIWVSAVVQGRNEIGGRASFKFPD